MMKKLIRKIVEAAYKRLGHTDIHPDFEKYHNDIWDAVQPYTMTSKERVYGLIEAVKYISHNKIEGSIVECGVWKGGSMQAVAKTLLNENDKNRDLYLYDTFEGMSEPTAQDVDVNNKLAETLLKKAVKNEASNMWCISTLENVQNIINSTNYPVTKIKYVKGKVEDTIPQTIPEKIALLRLDTDWYESTKHELIHLFPLLQKGGVLIIDDYGFWKGARKAVDEYFEENNIQIMLSRMDSTGRIAVKQ